MPEYPISDEAVEAACIAEHGDSPHFPWERESMPYVKKRRAEVRVGIRAFLEAEGFEVERIRVGADKPEDPAERAVGEAKRILECAGIDISALVQAEYDPEWPMLEETRLISPWRSSEGSER